MSVAFKRPLTEEEKKILAAKLKPSAQDVQDATDNLFMNILLRLNEVEAKLEGKDDGELLSIQSNK